MLSRDNLQILRNDPTFQELIKEIEKKKEYALIRFREGKNLEELLRAQAEFNIIEEVLYILLKWQSSDEQ